MDSIILRIESEELINSWVMSVNISPLVSDIKRVAPFSWVSLRLDGSSLEVELEELSLSSIWCLDDSSVWNQINVSVFSQHWNNMEWFIDFKSPFLRVSTSYIWCFVSIDDIPKLVVIVVSGVFSVSSSHFSIGLALKMSVPVIIVS
jgi:hypothetical protein